MATLRAVLAWNAGGDGPAWTRQRQPFEPAVPTPDGHGAPTPSCTATPTSRFLDGASHPEELAEEAARLGLEALALTDHDGFYGVVRFAEAAKAVGLPTVFGAELTLGMPAPQNGAARSRTASTSSCWPTGPRAMPAWPGRFSLGAAAGEKGAPRHEHRRAGRPGGGRLVGAHGMPQGRRCPPRSISDGPGRGAHASWRQLIDAFGRDRVVVELWDHGDPLDSARNDALAELAARADVACIATNNVHYAHARPPAARHRPGRGARPAQPRRDRPWLPGRRGRPPALRCRAGPPLRPLPRRGRAAAEIGRAAAFDLSLVAPQPAAVPVPATGSTRWPTCAASPRKPARRRYGERPRRGRAESLRARAWATIDHELAIIEALGFPGYFLVVWDIVEFCRRSNIFCQGRGSAANSAVCYALGITNGRRRDARAAVRALPVARARRAARHRHRHRERPPGGGHPVRLRALRPPPRRAGGQRHHLPGPLRGPRHGQGARVRPRPAGRVVASRSTRWGRVDDHAPSRPTTTSPSRCSSWPSRSRTSPATSASTPGGMVICDRPVIEVCPVEWGRMENRSVLQWDKDDCAAVGLVKFDLLGPGHAHAPCTTPSISSASTAAIEVDLATIPQDDEVYDMLCRADTVGVFQVESRAQMATLPRLKPRTFYDLVVEVALIRPGPIQGGSVHPYIRRRNGQEPVTYLHPLLENSLAKTLGVPLFQEQLMQMAIDVAGFTPWRGRPAAPGDGLEALASAMERLRARLYEGMAERGITGEIADEIFDKMAAFANYGFPESHSVSSPTSCTRRRGSSSTSRRRSARRCSTPSRWASTRRTRSCRTPAATAWMVRTPDLNASAATGHAGACARRAHKRRGGAARCRVGARRSATTWPRRSPRAVRTATLEDVARRCRR